MSLQGNKKLIRELERQIELMSIAEKEAFRDFYIRSRMNRKLSWGGTADDPADMLEQMSVWRAEQAAAGLALGSPRLLASATASMRQRRMEQVFTSDPDLRLAQQQQQQALAQANQWRMLDQMNQEQLRPEPRSYREVATSDWADAIRYAMGDPPKKGQGRVEFPKPPSPAAPAPRTVAPELPPEPGTRKLDLD